MRADHGVDCGLGRRRVEEGRRQPRHYGRLGRPRAPFATVSRSVSPTWACWVRSWAKAIRARTSAGSSIPSTARRSLLGTCRFTVASSDCIFFHPWRVRLPARMVLALNPLSLRLTMTLCAAILGVIGPPSAMAGMQREGSEAAIPQISATT